MKAKKSASAKISPPQGETQIPPTEEEIVPRRRPLAVIAEFYVLFLTFCLPLKFGTLIGVPEIPATYWDNFVGVFVASWPVLTFPVFSGLGLALTLLFAYPRKFRSLSMAVLGILWCLFAASSLTGIVRATTWDFYEHNVIYIFGTAAYALSLLNLFSHDRRFGKYLLGVLAASFVFSLYSAMMQYTVGFRDMTEYYNKRVQESGGQFYFDRFGRRLAEFRISADFSSGNAYSGYLLLLFPIVLALLCIAGGRVTPPLPARIILMLPAAGLFLFLLRQTKSRGCFLGLIAGSIVAVLALRYRKKIFLALCGFFACAFGAFCLLIAFDRGPRSILFRLDYFRAALRMMGKYPLLGAGWGEFFHNYFIYKDLINDEAPHTPHDFPLTLGSQCGIAAFLLSCLLILLPFVFGFLLLRKQAAVPEKTPEQQESFLLQFGLVMGFSSWFFHCLCEIDYETPGSFCTAAAVAFLILNGKEQEIFFPRFSFESLARKRSFPKWNALLKAFFLLFSLGTLFWISWKAPVLIAGEMAFDKLFTGVNPHFGRVGQPMATPDEAARLLKEAVEKLPRSPFPWDTYSHYVAAMGPSHAYEAIALVEEARKRSPRRASYYFRLSQAYRKLGNLPKAVEMLREAQKCSPKNPDYFDENQKWYVRYEDSDSLW